jgi:hypothetical protein
MKIGAVPTNVESEGTKAFLTYTKELTTQVVDLTRELERAKCTIEHLTGNMEYKCEGKGERQLGNTVPDAPPLINPWRKGPQVAAAIGGLEEVGVAQVQQQVLVLKSKNNQKVSKGELTKQLKMTKARVEISENKRDELIVKCVDKSSFDIVSDTAKQNYVVKKCIPG